MTLLLPVPASADLVPRAVAVLRGRLVVLGKWRGGRLTSGDELLVHR
jgi:hypothetical protein